MSSESAKSTLSEYGVYTVSDSLDLLLPDTAIRISRIGENAFSYSRRDSEGNTVEKMIPAKSNEIKVELAPIRPLNHPARRTGHVFLEFDLDIYLGEDSAASIFVRCPIEIGIFLVLGSAKHSLDWVTCSPINSRFGLYGQPDTGTLCKYARVPLASDYGDSTPYVDGVIKITIENTLKIGQTVSKVVFPITDNSVYYDGSKTIFDGIRVTMKKRAAVNIADIKTDPADTKWTESPTWEETTAGTAMEMGLE